MKAVGKYFYPGIFIETCNLQNFFIFLLKGDEDKGYEIYMKDFKTQEEAKVFGDENLSSYDYYKVFNSDTGSVLLHKTK